MNKVIQFPIRNISYAKTEQLKKEWDIWCSTDEETYPVGVCWHYEDIHKELNKRREGEYCAV